MAVVQVSIVPIGVSGTSLSAYVARALRVLQESPLEYQLTAMGTIISGDLDLIWDVLRKMHESCFELDAPRMLTQIKIDDRRDKRGDPGQKVKSVMEKLSGERE